MVCNSFSLTRAVGNFVFSSKGEKSTVLNLSIQTLKSSTSSAAESSLYFSEAFTHHHMPWGFKTMDPHFKTLNHENKFPLFKNGWSKKKHDLIKKTYRFFSILIMCFICSQSTALNFLTTYVRRKKLF